MQYTKHPEIPNLYVLSNVTALHRDYTHADLKALRNPVTNPKPQHTQARGWAQEFGFENDSNVGSKKLKELHNNLLNKK